MDILCGIMPSIFELSELTNIERLKSQNEHKDLHEAAPFHHDVSSSSSVARD